jgi:AraC-like DNA-binding protein
VTTKIDYGAGLIGLKAQREHSRDICDIEPIGPIEEFCSGCELIKIGATLLLLSRTSSVLYTRRPVHLVRGGDDHYQIQFLLDGSLRGAFSTLLQGDIGVHSTGVPSVSEFQAAAKDQPARVLVWMVPRILLAPLLVDPDAAHGMRFDASLPYTRLLTGYLWSAWEAAPHCTEQERETIAYSLLLLVAAGLGAHENRGEQTASAPRTAKLDAIKLHLETQLGAEIDVPGLARHFGLSRASLYRLFAPEGGLASYVRSRRLHRAARLLVSPAHRHLRILDVALDSHFASETSFTRSFRRELGISPAELRASLDPHGVVRLPVAPPLDWLRQVGALFPTERRRVE